MLSIHFPVERETNKREREERGTDALFELPLLMKLATEPRTKQIKKMLQKVKDYILDKM